MAKSKGRGIKEAKALGKKMRAERDHLVSGNTVKEVRKAHREFQAKLRFGYSEPDSSWPAKCLAILKKQQDLNLNYQHLRWHTNLNQEALDAIQKMELSPRASPQPVPPPIDQSNQNLDLNHSIEVPSGGDGDETTSTNIRRPPPRNAKHKSYILLDDGEEEDIRVDGNQDAHVDHQLAPHPGPPQHNSKTPYQWRKRHNGVARGIAPQIHVDAVRDIQFITFPDLTHRWTSPRDIRSTNPAFFVKRRQLVLDATKSL